MGERGKVNYEAYRKMASRPGVSAAPLAEYDELPLALQYAWDNGADAVEEWLSTLPVDEDAPGNEPAKVVIVTEANGRERRYRADDWEGGQFLSVRRRDAREEAVAVYAPGAWLSAREDGAEVPDYATEAAVAGRDALTRIWIELNSDNDPEQIRKLTDEAVGKLADLGFE